MEDKRIWRASIKEQVESSNLHSIEYYPKKQTLIIEFLRGNIYQYYKVPEDIAEDLINAESKGKYFRANIMNKFETEKVV